MPHIKEDTYLMRYCDAMRPRIPNGIELNLLSFTIQTHSQSRQGSQEATYFKHTRKTCERPIATTVYRFVP